MLFAAFNPSTWTLPALIAAATFVLLVRLKARRRAMLSGTMKPSGSVNEVLAAKFGSQRSADSHSQIASHAAAERQLVAFYDMAREIEARLDMKRALIGAVDPRSR
ncbi:MAG: hypothetical protein QM775_22605 [Pirellulales bacterium]